MASYRPLVPTARRLIEMALQPVTQERERTIERYLEELTDAEIERIGGAASAIEDAAAHVLGRRHS